MKRIAISLAAVAALSVAVAIPAVGQSQSPDERTVTVTAHTASVKVVDLAPRGRVAAGDMLVGVSRLRDSAGRRVGTSYLNCGIAKGSRTFERALFQCTGTHRLKGGTITIAGVARLGSAKVIRIAVTGGTGAYRGVTGELVNTATSDSVSTQTFTLRN
jgi:hypothetical protein